MTHCACTTSKYYFTPSNGLSVSMSPSPSDLSTSSTPSTVFERDVEIPHLTTPAPFPTRTHGRHFGDSTEVANPHFHPRVHATERIELSIPLAVEALLGSDGTSLVGGLESPMIEGSNIDSPTGDSAFPVSSLPLTPSSSNWSTSSALSSVFERTIEYPQSLSSYAHTNHSYLLNANPHYVPRVHSTEQLELSVPSVLDSALELLLSPAGEADVGVAVAASPGRSRGSGSRSPSSGRSRSASSSMDLDSDAHFLASPSSIYTPYTSSPSSDKSPSKTISFISYADLLSSTPTSTVPLSSLTTCARAEVVPPHTSGLHLEAF